MFFILEYETPFTKVYFESKTFQNFNVPGVMGTQNGPPWLKFDEKMVICLRKYFAAYWLMQFQFILETERLHSM